MTYGMGSVRRGQTNQSIDGESTGQCVSDFMEEMHSYIMQFNETIFFFHRMN